jgi:hypothetical protein
LSESQRSLSYSAFDTDSELDDRGFDVVVNDDSDGDDSITLDFVWETWKTIRDEGKICEMSTRCQATAQ